jgi:hypothetical protein
VVLVIQFSQLEPFMLLSFICVGSLLQVITVMKKRCGLGNSVSEEYTACIFRRLSKDEGNVFCRTVCMPDDLVSVWKDTVSILFGLK